MNKFYIATFFILTVFTMSSCTSDFSNQSSPVSEYNDTNQDDGIMNDTIEFSSALIDLLQVSKLDEYSVYFGQTNANYDELDDALIFSMLSSTSTTERYERSGDLQKGGDLPITVINDNDNKKIFFVRNLSEISYDGYYYTIDSDELFMYFNDVRNKYYSKDFN